MKRLLFIAGICVVAVLGATGQQQKPKILLLGSFHFDNPGLDVAKFESVNALSSKRQQEIGDILAKLKQFKPDKIFVEVPVELQPKLDSNFQLYKNDKFVLRASETHQLGYRLAKELNLPGLYAVDYNGTDFPFDSLMTSAAEAKQFTLIENINRSVDSIQRRFNESLKKHTIREMLLEENSAPMVDLQVAWYFNLLVAGKEGNHVGSYLISEWWRRNMVICENILKRLTGKEERILVIFGAGHTALLQQMLKYNKNMELVPVAAVL